MTRDLRPIVTGLAMLAIAGAIIGEPLVLDRLRVVLAGVCGVAMLAAWLGTPRLAATMMIGAGPLLAGLALVLDADRPGDLGLGSTPLVSMMTVLVGGGLVILLLDDTARAPGMPEARARRRR
jgi:hypothetical protein